MSNRDIILDRSLPTRKRGDALENEIIDILKELDVPHRKTNGSGSVHGDGDVEIFDMITADAKVEGMSTHISIRRPTLQKVALQAAKTGKFGAIVSYVDVAPAGDVFITMRLRDMLNVVYAVADKMKKEGGTR